MEKRDFLHDFLQTYKDNRDLNDDLNEKLLEKNNLFLSISFPYSLLNFHYLIDLIILLSAFAQKQFSTTIPPFVC